MADIQYYTLSLENSTEYEFMSSVIDYIVSLDNTKISCISSIEDELVNSDHRAVFDFVINGRFILRLKRGLANNVAGSNYEGSYGYIPIICDTSGNQVTLITGGETRTNTVNFMASGYIDTSIGTAYRTTRTWKIMSIIDDDIFGIFIIPYNGVIFEESNNNECALLSFVDTESKYWTVTRMRSRIFGDTENQPTICKRCDNFAIVGKVAKMFKYSADVGYIDYLSHLIIKDSDNYKIADTKTLYSSSNTTPGTSYGLINGSFMSLDPNVLIKVDTDD